MSLMIPSNLSGARTAPRLGGSDDAASFEKNLDDTEPHSALETRPGTALQSGQASPVGNYETPGPETTAVKTKMPQRGGASGYFDEEGTELGKEAKFWKVYVKETDRWDAEVIDSWNKSLDVILVFAALFSAISTAFLIESSKKLQQDPTDTSAQSLVVISQTLLAMANNLPPPGPEVLLPNGAEAFTPTYNAIVINILWYLSLSISLATAFIAALAKEWCQSFLAGRTGHPCIQARRRQQKWSMIEKWRMEELITLLPTLIHIALLLFSIGLCF
ncbi:unnamed protein product [Rhizoctonia solani]|uniref:DUF6535 domain-containing protein n=1 Tax=Rhizoctonia solani TaxID=456999 RepID=A0A8H3CUS4_9AGAM|nr:unnamed protein product [Rhizoctonia solani]